MQRLSHKAVIGLVIGLGFAGNAMAEDPPLDPDKIKNAINASTSGAPTTTIYTNVFNFSGTSCVEASGRRGQAIANNLQTMKENGDIPPGYAVEVHTYSGYRVPGFSEASLHTYNVTQVRDASGRVVHTWTSDDYLGPSTMTHYDGDGGYSDWTGTMTSDVAPTNVTTAPDQPTDQKQPDRSGGSGGGGSGGSGSGGGGGGGGSGGHGGGGEG
jgi:uncharacterized membrane protein YgcG